MNIFPQIIILLSISSIWMLFITHTLKLSHLYQLALLTAIVIIALALAPIYLFHIYPSEHSYFDFTQGRIFGFISLKTVFILFWFIWAFAFTTFAIAFIYKTELETAILGSLLFYMPALLCLSTLFLIDHFYMKINWLNYIYLIN